MALTTLVKCDTPARATDALRTARLGRALYNRATLATRKLRRRCGAKVSFSVESMPSDLIVRAVRSAAEKGMRRTAQSVLSVCEDALFEARNGVSTMARIEQSEIDVASESRRFGHRHQATRVRHFRMLMKKLALPRESVFVDFGSGMGRALLIATRFDFRRIVGVEYSRELCELARHNSAIFRRKTGRGSNIEIVEADAATYEIQDDQNVFYFYNSFDAEILAQVQANIMRSLDTSPRPMWLVYNHCDIVGSPNENGAFELAHELTYGGTEIRVYRSN